MGRHTLFYCLFFSLIANALALDWQIYYYNIPCDTKQLNQSFNITQEPVLFAIFYCTGEVNQYSALNAQPDQTTNAVPYADTLYQVEGFYGTGTYNFLWQTRSAVNASTNVCASIIFAIFFNQTDFNSLYVNLTGISTESGQEASDGKSGEVSWTKAPDATSYDVYWAYTQEAPTGYSFSTACSVRAWMNNFTDAQGSVKDNGDNTMTATVNSLDPTKPFTVVVVANKDNAISGVYDRIALNGKNDGGALLPSVMLAVVVILAMLW